MEHILKVGLEEARPVGAAISKPWCASVLLRVVVRAVDLIRNHFGFVKAYGER